MLLRRRIASANPALHFSELLFIKRESLRGVMEHCCDQYYGQQQRSGGGLFALTDPFGPAPGAARPAGGAPVGPAPPDSRSLSARAPRRDTTAARAVAHPLVRRPDHRLRLCRG